MNAAEHLIPYMSKEEATSLILTAKKRLGLSWEAIAEKLSMSPVWTHSACLGMNSMPKEKAEVLVDILKLPSACVEALEEKPTKIWEQSVPTDPAIYRLYEIVGVYGPTIKDLVQEKFGDGIMSAIDFEMYIDRIEDPKGDRVKVTMSGKFLGYKNW
jgi:cyanate lyase